MDYYVLFGLNSDFDFDSATIIGYFESSDDCDKCFKECNDIFDNYSVLRLSDEQLKNYMIRGRFFD